MRRLLLLLSLLSLQNVAHADLAPAKARLKQLAPRGIEGRPGPIDDGQWAAFNGQVSEAHAARYRDPAYRQTLPLSGVRVTTSHPQTHLTAEQVATVLGHKGVAPSIARRAADHVLLGLPSDADHASSDDYLLARRDSVISYSNARRSPNWISWKTTRADLGKAPRSNDSWRADPSLPANFTPARFSDYDGSGYDPGHLVRSAERTASAPLNRRTFVMTNLIPQSFNNNRGPWLDLENHYLNQVRDHGLEAHVIAGGTYGAKPLTIGSGLAVPNATWKIVVMLKPGQTLADIDAHTPVISAMIPNNDVEVSQKTSFRNYLTTPAEIERATGLKFFSHLPANVAEALRRAPSAN